jgi:hypothetical protein
MPEFRMVGCEQVPHRAADSSKADSASDVASRTDDSPSHTGSAHKMIRIFRWLVLIGFCAWGGYAILWAFQSASFSVPAGGAMKAVYETRAMLALPLGVILIVTGVLAFVQIGRRKRQPERTSSGSDVS